jgi:PAS domain S-box-containing protein
MANTENETVLDHWKARLKTWLGRLIEQRWLNLGLLGKMSALVIIGVISLIGIFALLGISSARQTTQQALNERMKFAQLTAELLDTSLFNLSSSLTRLAQFPLLDDPAINQAEIQNFFNSVIVFDQGVHLVNKNGVDEFFTEENSHPEVGWTDILAVQNALAGNQGANISLLSEEQPSIVVAAPVFTENGSVGGALVAILELSNTRIFPSKVDFNLGETGTLDILDQSGFIIHSSHPQRIMQKETKDAILNRLFESDETGVETCLGCTYDPDLQFVDQVVAFAPLQQAPWGVVIRQDVTEAFMPVRILMFEILFMGALTIAGALVLVWLTTRSVITPIQSLQESAGRIAQGDLDTPVKQHMEDWPLRHIRRRDEIGDLVNSFDQMRHQLKQSIEEIQAWNQDLDRRVQERTQQALDSQLEAQSTRDDLVAIINALDDELVVINVEDFSVQQMNKAAISHHGLPPDELFGQSCYDIFHEGNPCQNPNCECPLPSVLERKESVRVTQVRKNGHKHQDRYLDIVASPMFGADGKVTRIVELTRDVTEEKRIKEDLVRKNQQLAILNKISTTVNESLDLTEMLERSLSEILRLTGIDVGAIFLLNESLGDLNLMAHQGLSKEAAQLAAQLGMLDGSCGGVIERGQVAIIPDISRYRGKRANSLIQEHLKSLMHVPLTTKGCTLGSMCVATREKHSFGKEDEELLTAIGSQIAVAIENARLYAEVQHKEHIRAVLYKKIVNAQEDERRRIARELHDDTSQALTALIFSAEEGLELSNTQEIKERLHSMRNIIQNTLDGVHQIIFDLRPSMLDHLGLVPAMRWFAETHLESKGARVTIKQETPIKRLSPELETALFRVVQEAITNVARHSAARNVELSIRLESNEICVDIIDDGIGFEINTVTISPDSGRGLGLLGMEERLELLNGELNVEAAPGAGTKVFIRVPINGMELTHA